MGALDGVKVLEFSHYIAGPFCGQILADHGADVIKVEPIEGEPGRNHNSIVGEKNFFFPTFNRSKRSLAVDLKNPEGFEVVKQLISTADVLITNYAVGVPERLGIGYESVAAMNPGIVMVHLSGFGLTGPYRSKNAFDSILQAMCGLNDLTGEPDGPPLRTGLFVADHIGGFQAVIGVIMALYSKKITGKGQLVDVSMLDAMVSMLAYNIPLAKMLNYIPRRAGNHLSNTFTTYSPCKDGYVIISAVSPKMWKSLCKIIGHEDWAEDASPYATVEGRLENYDYLEALIGDWTQQRSRVEILDLMGRNTIPCAPIYSVYDVVNDPHLQQRGMIMPLKHKVCGEIVVPGTAIKFCGTPSRQPHPAPELGEHTEEILSELGYAPENVIKMKADQIVKW